MPNRTHLQRLIADATGTRLPSTAALTALLSLTDQADIDALFEEAYEVKKRTVGTTVYFRGIVEFSNECVKNCYYCGIRRDNRQVKRFNMDDEAILTATEWAHDMGYGSVVLQGGERHNPAYVKRIESLLREIHRRTDHELGITISLGEQTRDVYQRWFDAGASRYLLRVETSCRELYGRLHPMDHCFDRRAGCLRNLREIGYQVGTGVMIGLPGQSILDLAEDIRFFKRIDVDMIGMGPYVVHQQTPLGRRQQCWTDSERLDLALKMVAICRLVMPDINIAATTALQALNPSGRELGLKAGANIIMPNLTDTRYREAYQLYDNKPCTDENSTQCRGCLERRISSIGEQIGFGQQGNSAHYHRRREALS